MTATVSTAYANHLKGRSHNLCWLLRLDLRDGTVIGVTDHDQVLTLDLSDGAGAIDYRPDLGMILSDVQTGTGLDAGNYEVTFPITDPPKPFTRAAVLGGVFNRSETKLMQVVWSNLPAGPRKFMLGNTGEWRVDGDKAIAESRDQRDRLNQTIGRQVQNQCDASYADQVRCFAVETTADVTVTAVTDAMRFTTSNPDSRATGFFDRGKIVGLTGANAGVIAPVWSWNSSGAVQLLWGLPEAPTVGDTFTLKDGCDHTARGPNGCMAHGQILNFRGCPEVPGQQALKPAVAPSQSSGGKKG